MITELISLHQGFRANEAELGRIACGMGEIGMTDHHIAEIFAVGIAKNFTKVG